VYPPLRITSIRTWPLHAEIPERFGWSLGWTNHRYTNLVEIRTDEGITGWGEGATGWQQYRLIGKSAFEIAAAWETSRMPTENLQRQRRRGAPTAAGVDIALWDIVGKALGKPCCQLLGPVHRTRVEAYCTAMYRQDQPDFAAALAEEARAWKTAGYRHLKMKIGFGPHLDETIVATVRAAIGPNIALAADANCAYDATTAIALAKRLEQFDLAWWEEPLVADDLEGYDRLRASTSIPLASGETESTDWLIANYIQPRRVGILQPDLEWVGFTGFRQLSHLCWLNRIRLIPHNWGSAIRTAATLHAMATCPPLTEALSPPPLLFEFDRTPSPFRDAVVEETFDIDPTDSCVAVPMKPGLGVTVIPEAVEHYSHRPLGED
jgi:D-galactarolactone cycloisomerase